MFLLMPICVTVQFHQLKINRREAVLLNALLITALELLIMSDVQQLIYLMKVYMTCLTISSEYYNMSISGYYSKS